MPYGLYISGEGAGAQARRMEVIANNLANVATPGFKRELAVISARHAEAIAQHLDYAGSGSINDLGGGVAIQETVTEFSPGVMSNTGIPSDMAIDGKGFFLVERDEQTLLTRAGNFRFTPEGRLVTQEGFPVLGEDRQPIQIDPTLPWQLQESGILVQAGGQFPLGLVKPASLGDLSKAGQNLFAPLADTIPLRPEERRVRGGYLELSAVKPALEMMEMIEASRAFESNIRMIQSQDQMLGSLVTRVMRQA